MLQPYKLEKADFSSLDQISPIRDASTRILPNVIEAIYMVNEPAYLYWDKIKYSPRIPKNIPPVAFWQFVKEIRKYNSQKTAIKAESGNFYTWFHLNYTDEFLHKIDMQLGSSKLPVDIIDPLDPEQKKKFLTKSIMEEAIASSQLEGAITTTNMAKKILSEKRKPTNESERMIVNNYKTMQAINQEYKNKKLSIEVLFELHKLITKDTLINQDKEGRFRRDSDDITINDQMNYIYYIPPKADFVSLEIKRLILFANNEDNSGFIHPIIKAIFLHFWIAILHPFYDGNGRLARTIFYWYLLREGYWAMQYLPISLVIKEAPLQYGMAYVYSEQDDYDLTYFYDFHMRKLMQALKNFKDYLKRKIEESKMLETSFYSKLNLNHRQIQSLRYLLSQGENAYINPSSYEVLCGTSRTTAISDLKILEKMNLVQSKKMGKYKRYYGTNELKKKVTKKNKLN